MLSHKVYDQEQVKDPLPILYCVNCQHVDNMQTVSILFMTTSVEMLTTMLPLLITENHEAFVVKKSLACHRQARLFLATKICDAVTLAAITGTATLVPYI